MPMGLQDGDSDGNRWQLNIGNDSCTVYQPPKPEKKNFIALTQATHKDLKLTFDRIRLNTWCEDIKFSLITPGTYLEFDELQVKFVTK